MKEIWLYGAGDMGKKIHKCLSDCGINISGFIDSDEKKYKSRVCDKQVLSLDQYIRQYLNKTYIIITPESGEIQQIIRTNIMEEGVKLENIVTKEYIIRKYWRCNIDFHAYLKKSDSKTWIVDTGDWGSFGGVEKYTFTLVRLLDSIGENARFIFPSELDLVPDDIKPLAINYNFYTKRLGEIENHRFLANMQVYEEIDFSKRICEAIKILLKIRPFTLILRNISLWYVAASIIKDYFPNEVTIVSVIHGNESGIRYETNVVQDDIVAVICSNSRIKRKFLEEGMHAIEKKLIVKSHPILPVKKIVKERTEHGRVHIGYAGRLDIIDKRSDLIPVFLEELEKYYVEYEFYIAGDGPYKKELEEWLSNNNYRDKVKLLGKIPYDEIYEFWTHMDIFVNFSDTEGFCLSMIEALQCGVACVSTYVHDDVNIYIKNNENGYVIPIRDMGLMAQKVSYLIMHPELIKLYGENSKKIISQLEGGQEYIQLLKSL